jgi:hypothetical protein
VREAIVESGAATSVGDEFDAEANFSESHAANRYEFDVAIGRGLHCGDERVATTLALEAWNSSATSSQPWTVTCCRPLAAHRRNQLAESGLGVLEQPVAGQQQVAPRRPLTRSGGRVARMRGCGSVNSESDDVAAAGADETVPQSVPEEGTILAKCWSE